MSKSQATPVNRREASNARRVIVRLRRQPATVMAFGFILLLVVVAIAAPWLAPYHPADSNFDHVLEAPSAQFLLGTDDLGRDQLSRLIYGARIVLLVALGAVVVAMLIGVPVGLFLGYHGGWWDRVGMRFVDMAQSLPGMLIGIIVITILGRNMFILMFAIGLIFSMNFARLSRATVLVERSKAYVEAASVVGLRNIQILFGQLLPNLVGLIITQGAVFFGSAIMIESAMSFLGIGLDGRIPTWGAMLSLAVDMQNVAPHLTWPPGIAIVLTVLSFNVFGDGLNDAMTGERRGRRRLPRFVVGKNDVAAATGVVAGEVATAEPETPAPSSRPSSSPPSLSEPGPVDERAARENGTQRAAQPVLRARGVTVSLARPDGDHDNLVQSANLEVGRGEVVGLLGESGSGKSTLARAVLGMLPPGLWLAEGSICLGGTELAGRSYRAMRPFRGAQIGAIFQDPMLALSPVHTVATQLVEPLRIHKGMNRKAARERAVELLDRVGVNNAAQRLDDYPHQFSGGMAQRVAIAMALAAEPSLLIADEATSALDVTTQSQVLDLILDLRDEYGMGVLMITHSLGVVAETCDRTAVMYRGCIVEDGPVEQLFDAPRHAYTKALLAASPHNATSKGRLPTIDAETRAIIDASPELLETRS